MRAVKHSYLHHPYCYLVGVLALATPACSGGTGQGPGNDPFATVTGELVASLESVPDDVRCVEINTSDWRLWQVRTDVTPGSSATIRLAPLSPGYISLWGAAYSTPCWTSWNDAGGSTRTWEADYTSANVEAGRASSVRLTFRKLGSLDVSVDFAEPCICDTLPPPAVDGGALPCFCGSPEGGGGGTIPDGGGAGGPE